MSRDFIVQAQVIKREAPFVQVGNVVTIIGKDGSLIYTAAGVPSNSLGVYTDLYIDTVAPNNFYQKNASNIWVLKGSLKGVSGDDGREVLIQNNGTHIQWQYEGDTEWTNIVELSTLKGDTGANIELNKSATHIQWRVVGDTNWIDLVALVDLKGDAGYTPQKGVDYFDGLTPYIGINGNWWIGDVDQNIKAEGVDGISPTIGLNGNWYLGAVDTGVKAQGQDGYTPIKGMDYFDGITPTIGLNKHWFIGAIDTGIVAEGKDGEDGVTPIITIGENENWYINGVDSGKPSRGDNGTSAYEIYHAGGGTLSEAEFNESITDIPTHIEDATKHIDTTTAEFSGTIDETNDKLTIWDNSLLKLIRFSFTSLKTFIGTYFLKLDQTTPQTISQSPKINDLVEGQMCYVDANKQLKPIDVFWDNVNKRMGVNKAVPTRALDVIDDITASGIIRAGNGVTVMATSGVYIHTNSDIFYGNTNSFSNATVSIRNKNTDVIRIANDLNVGIKTITPKSALQVAGGIQCGDDTAAASADKVGTIRQRDVNNNTLLEFCKNTAGVYEWEKINDKLNLDQTTPQTIQGNVNINGNLNAVTTNVNQSTLPSVNASQDAAILQDGSAFTGTDYVMPTNNVAVKFVASAAHTMGDFTVRVKSSATLTSTTATLRGYLYSDNAGSPSTLLATGNPIRHGSITTSYQELSLGTQYNLVTGTTYWLVIRWNSAPTGGNIIFDSNTDTNGGATSADATSWTLTNVRLRYRLRGRTFYGINAFSTNDYGVYGTSTNNYGVYGTSTNYFGVYGVSTNSIGVYGSSTNYFGVYGTSTNSVGVRGDSTNYFGVYGVSTNSVGVYGLSTSNYGVYGVSTSNYGVYGESTSSYGVRGFSTNSIGVYGSSINNRAGYFSRNTATPTNAVPVVEIIQDHASDPNSVLDVKQDGTGEIARFFDAGVEVASIEKGGLGVYKKGVVIGDNTDVASYENKGATRYRENAGGSFYEMVMKQTDGSYAWVSLVSFQ